MIAIMSVADVQDRERHYCLVLQLVMVATISVANVWNGGNHCHLVFAVGHGCNYVRGQCAGWKAPLSPSSCSGS